ncbi:BadF/BadG/BcrA/BcrD ATPase family protein [Aestuariibacter sp. A3R04]|uniref:BadF/BadG/BcrA/BcrD ATPase family protein n=1 Tax=Aestuariibacter sp. A3R04 TaxID=2841571 RepID=UPI001C0934FE|nr:BadF/BadG/BcrA/BcrD ATPase family protein [Aestuariibacter sp. A3R04]MBU3020529.1 ATPase [Aestuariibacter sp. A3R04]
MTFFIGIDGGGSHCRALLQDANGTYLGEGQGGPANPVNGVQLAQSAILDACAQAIGQAGLPQSALSSCCVGAGLAGLHLPAMAKAMENWVHPFQSMCVTTDLHAAILGAHQGRDGAVLILGTGFSALAISKNRELALGGMGFPVNALGSGSWLGLEAVKAVLLAADELGPETLLQELLLANTSSVELAQKTVNGDATIFGRFAPLVFEAAAKGDAVAEGLLNQAAAFAERVIRKMTTFGAPETVLIGSVAHALRSRLAPQIQELITEGEASPQAGAILFAKQVSNHSI